MQDKYRLVTGFGAWHIGSIKVSDGPHGVRSQEDGEKNNDSYEATCFPTASAAACSWDRDLIAMMAKGIAAEAKSLGVSVVLGPGVNIKRSPLCGRNFEYYSEDPFLAGTLAAEYIKAMQEEGVGTSLKHFAGKNQETHRMTANSMIDPRALHEIYLAAFRIAVTEGKPATVMGAYNHVNGVPACENAYLLTDVLRNKWGYKGLVMSDWGACVDLAACIKAGMDVEMPDSNGNHYEDLKAALKSGRLSEEDINRAVRRISRLCSDHPARDKNSDKKVPDDIRSKNHILAAKIEEESAVLLKNDSFLPLKKDTEFVLIGDLACSPRIQGGGSSHINTKRIDTVKRQFTEHGARFVSSRGYRSNTFKRDKKLEKEALKLVRGAADKKIPVLFFGGLTDMAEGEGYDRESFDLPENQKTLLGMILEITDHVGFISFGGSPYDMTLPSKCRAILQMYLGGEAVAEAVAAIVMGDINPSGKLAETIPLSEKDVPSYGHFGLQGKQKLHPDDVEYRESIFVGYRYYDTFGIPVRFCFGHGLSYTEFQYSDPEVKSLGNNEFSVSFCVENTGFTEGSETAQLYVVNPEGNAFRPRRELKGFEKVALDPGEKMKVTIRLDPMAFSAYQDDDFKVIDGKYRLQIGSSLVDIRLEQEVEIKGDILRSPLSLTDKVPLSSDDFGLIYKAERTHFSDLKPGEYTLKNSLIQMKKHSFSARFWIFLGRVIVRCMYFPKPASDPEVRMFLEGLLEGNIDCICNQSGGIVSRKTIKKIVDSANRR